VPWQAFAPNRNVSEPLHDTQPRAPFSPLHKSKTQQKSALPGGTFYRAIEQTTVAQQHNLEGMNGSRGVATPVFKTCYGRTKTALVGLLRLVLKRFAGSKTHLIGKK
jgi:hypothetical protein